MKKFLIAVSLAATSFAFAAPAGKPVDPLWAKTVAQTAPLKKWIPEDIDMDVVVNNDGEITKSKSRSHLTGWEKGKPHYVVKEIESSKKSGKDKEGNFNVDGFTAMTEELLTEDAKFKRIDNQTLRGKTWTMFRITESKAGVKMDVKLWVEPQSGALYQTESVVNVPLLADIVIITSYGTHPEIGLVPTISDINVDLRIPFKSGTFHMMNTPRNWIKRPN